MVVEAEVFSHSVQSNKQNDVFLCEPVMEEGGQDKQRFILE